MDYFTIADVSFWGHYTVWGTFLAGFILVVTLIDAVKDSDGTLFVLGLVTVGVLWGLFVGLIGFSGVLNEQTDLKTAEMERIGYDNLTWNGDEFTGSREGYYVVGFIKQHGDIYYVTDITRKGEQN